MEMNEIHKVVLSPDQELAWDLIKQGKNLFVTARAGAGKSFLVDYIKDNFMGRVITVASTGVAANNVGGRTIHSQFLISTNEPNAEESAEKVGSGKRGYQIRSAKMLIIDEISMVSDALLDTVNKVCQIVRGNYRPFGGLQVVLFGDFLQLPPVFKGATANDTVCLGCQCWKDANIEIVLMTTNFRQKDDLKFFRLLTRLRYNKLTQADISLIRSRELPAPETAVRLYALNAEVDRLNSYKYAKLDPSTEHTYDMVIWGEDNARVESFKRDTLMEEQLKIRLGCRVMMLVNEDVDGGYLYNGALGEVIGFEGGFPLVQFDCGILSCIGMRETSITEKDDLGRVRVLVSCTQVPLKLAWAATVHKMQGMSVDQAFIDCSSMFISGHLYVALSRVRHLNGVFITGFNPNMNGARSDDSMVDFYVGLEQEAFERNGT